MLGGSLRAPAAALVVVAASAVGCADLIGLNDLDGSGGSGGTAGSDDSGSGGDSLGGSEGSDCTLDSFSDRNLTEQCWHTYNEDLLFGGTYTQDEEDGVLITRPEPGRGWYDGDTAFLLYQEVTGDFLLEATFSVFAGATKQDPETYPDVSYATGGILAIPARQAFEDIEGDVTGYYAVKAGSLRQFDDPVIDPGFKAEVSFEGAATSGFEREDAQGWNEASVRLCRVGEIIWTGYRGAGNERWDQIHAGEQDNGYDTTESHLPHLTDAMYVGLLSEIRSDATDGSVRVVFSRAKFTTPESLDDCQL